MSICRSEVLFSSMMRDSGSGGGVVPGGGVGGGGALPHPPVVGGGGAATLSTSSNIVQDSLLVDGGDFNYSDQVKVNKNNYTLTFSQGQMSLYGSMSASAGGGVAGGGGATSGGGIEAIMRRSGIIMGGKSFANLKYFRL